MSESIQLRRARITLDYRRSQLARLELCHEAATEEDKETARYAVKMAELDLEEINQKEANYEACSTYTYIRPMCFDSSGQTDGG